MSAMSPAFASGLAGAAAVYPASRAKSSSDSVPGAAGHRSNNIHSQGASPRSAAVSISGECRTRHGAILSMIAMMSAVVYSTLIGLTATP